MNELGEVEGRSRTEEGIISLFCEIRDLLRENNTLLRENLTSAKTLAERREKNRLHMQAVRTGSVCTQTLTENEERKEAGEKEKSPHTPLKGKEGEEKREEKETTNPRAREGFHAARGGRSRRLLPRTAERHRPRTVHRLLRIEGMDESSISRRRA